MACPNAEKCQLITIFETRNALGAWKTLFCDAAPERCIHQRMAQTGGSVPLGLLPDGKTMLPPWVVAHLRA
jgi:hypothetical protein